MDMKDRGVGEKGGNAASPLIPLLILTGCAGLIAWITILSDLADLQPPPLVLRKTIYQEDENGCGPAALAMMLSDHGIACTPAEIAAGQPRRDGGMSMADLKSYAESRGLALSGWHLSYEDLRVVSKPAILLVSGGHFLVVDSIDGRGRALCRDPQAGNIIYPREVMAAMWHGEALVCTAMDR
jgi:ABC-type bacteriocin/lantibiotic exporter with double-glycine peptidase domain